MMTVVITKILVCLLVTKTNCQNLISPTLSSSTTEVVATNLYSSTITPIVTPTQSPVTTLQPSTPIRPCDSVPCKNGGTCTNVGANSYSCKCVSGWSGQTCVEISRIFSFNVSLEYIMAGALKITPEASKAIQNLLLDKSSQLFKSVCTLLISALDLAISADGILSVDKTVCVGFVFESVKFLFNLELLPEDTSGLDQVLECIINGVRLKEEILAKNVSFFELTFKGDDLNECQVGGYCNESAICTNLVGGFNCSCKTGFQLVDSSKCIRDHDGDDDNEMILIIVIAAVVAWLILFIAMIYILLVVRRWRRTRRRLSIRR